MAKTIFITGASRGFGKLWAEAFLDRGDKVVVTSRNLTSLQPLKDKYGDSVLALELDITNRAAAFEALAKAKSTFGTVDIVINNAAMGVSGMVEESDEKSSREIIEANFFGTLWVTQAAVPIMREQKSGHILQLSSALGVYSFPSLGLYSASKFAVEGLSEALSQEMKSFGVHVTIIQPNGFATEFGTTIVQNDVNPAYGEVRAELYTRPAMAESDVWGDPKATVAAILKVTDSTNPPLRLFLGKKAFPLAKAAYGERLATWEEWNDVAVAAHGN
ncbi:MAG: SDR family NAD(P)-dependent oxidoreductase [Chitinophagaceae bacterium]|nr:MAG: SDR family NAD(P)-dependent oxidoreductase [Chitinophagaceae bacterium]